MQTTFRLKMPENCNVLVLIVAETAPGKIDPKAISAIVVRKAFALLTVDLAFRLLPSRLTALLRRRRPRRRLHFQPLRLDRIELLTLQQLLDGRHPRLRRRIELA